MKQCVWQTQEKISWGNSIIILLLCFAYKLEREAWVLLLRALIQSAICNTVFAFNPSGQSNSQMSSSGTYYYSLLSDICLHKNCCAWKTIDEKRWRSEHKHSELNPASEWYLERTIIRQNLFLKCLEDISYFCGTPDTLFWNSNDVCLVFQSQGR